MNNELYLYFTYLKVVLAWSFCRIQGLDLLFFTNNKLFPILAQSFLRAQGLGSAESGIVLSYAGPGLSRIRRAREKESPKSKTNPKQSQNKPKQSQFFGGFWRKNFNFSLKIDDTKLNFLCKTKPILLFKNLIFYT